MLRLNDKDRHARGWADQTDCAHHGDKYAKPNAVRADAVDEWKSDWNRNEDRAHLVKRSSKKDVKGHYRHQNPERRETNDLRPFRELVGKLCEHNEARKNECSHHDEKDRRRGVNRLE